MAGSERWYYTSEQLNFSPSRKAGMDADMELSYRQRAANLIQDMGQRIQVSQLCINTAIVYMHRFYVFHSFTKFHRNSMAAASLFLAAKVEEQPRKIEHIIKALNSCLNGGEMSRDKYNEQAQDLVLNENILLQTLGFDVAIDHPHTYVVKTMQLVGASKDLAQTSYFMASNSLHLTTMCLQYKPTVVACFCIHLACQWSRWEIPRSSEGKSWFYYVDKSITMDLLKQLTDEFLYIFEKCPSRLKSKMNSVSQNAQTVERPISSKEDSNQNNAKHHPHHANQTHHHPHHQHHQHPHPHHQHHNKDHRSHKTGEKVNVQASTSNQGSNSSKIPPQGQQQLSQQSSSNKSSTSQKMPGMHQQHAQSSSSSSVKPPNHSHDPNQKQRSQNIYMENVHKNRPNYPGNQPGMPSSQKVPDQRHPKGPPGDMQNSSSKSSSKPSMYPNSANQEQYPPRSSSSSSSSNNSKSSLVYQQMSGSGSVKNQQSASVPMKSQKEATSSNKSFSLVDDSSHILDTMPRNDNSASSKAAPTSIFDPDYDGDIQAKSNKSSSLLKPNKDSPNKEKRSNTPSKKERRSDTPTGMHKPKLDMQLKSLKEEHRDARLSLMSGKSNSSPALPIKEEKLAIQQQREQQHLQRQIQKQNQRSTNVFDIIPGQKRPFSHLDTSSSSSFDAKKQKMANDFFESDFDAVFEGSTFGNNNSMVASNVDFSGHHNDNANSQTQFDNSYNNNNNSNQKETAKVMPVAAKESNPDFVKSLLQESFSSQDNKFLSTVDTNELKRCIQIPEELPEDLLAPVPAPLAPIAPITTQLATIQPIEKQQPPPQIQETISPLPNLLPNLQTENMDSEGSEYHRKSKKKKEKHKHKERSKDKEERKKHKKDKDKDRHRHKHRDRDEADGSNTMKMMVPEQPLKIKISKDVFDRQMVSANGVAAPAATHPLPTDSSIKIKIPKDKIKNYNDNSASYNSSSSSHKKNKEKDRDKDRSRDKDKDKEKDKDRAKNSSARHSTTNLEMTQQLQQQQQQPPTQTINKIPFNSMNYDYANMMSSGATKMPFCDQQPPQTQFQQQQQQQRQQQLELQQLQQQYLKQNQQYYQQQQQPQQQQQHQMQQHPQLNHQLMQQPITDNMYYSNAPQAAAQPNQWQQDMKMIREMVARKHQNK